MQMHFQTYYEPIVKKESKKNFSLLLTASAFSNLADGLLKLVFPNP